MGAGCSGQNAAKVQHTIRALELSPNAKKHLKDIADKEKERQKLKMASNGEYMDLEDSVEDLNKEIQSFSKEKKNQKLWEGIESNDIKRVQFLLNNYSEEQFGQGDIYDSSGNSMLHKAASLGHAEILMLLLERTGQKADLVNAQLATPLHLASKNNRESTAKFLIGCGVDVNAQDEHGQTPLLICCIHGHFEIAALIVESSIAGHTPEPLEIDLRDHRGLTPLNCSAIKGDLKFTKLLIERGGAKVEEASPKGCTPLLYAARGGYSDVVRFLLEKGASPLKQDNAGGTVLHHAIEKAHLDVLQVLVEHGVDVHQAINICDNGGRTPLFEAIDNNVSPDLLDFIIKKPSKGGFGAEVNVFNYAGQTPLYCAVRENNYNHARILIEDGGAKVDFCGLQTKLDEDEEGEEEYESLEEKYFMEAFKNAMTPLHLACVLGYDSLLHLLVANGANPNKQTSIKGYNCLHLAILANKPEIIIELLTKTNANHNMPDYGGRTLTDMIEQFIPSYLETFNQLIENLQIIRIQNAEAETQGVVMRHHYNPDDERQIQGVQNLEQPNQIYQVETNFKEEQKMVQSNQEDQNVNPHKKFLEMDEDEIEVEEGRQYEKNIENIFGRKVSLGLISTNWKFKEISIKIIYKQTEKFLQQFQAQEGQNQKIYEYVKACTIAIDLTSKEKVVKVFTICIQLLALIISSNLIETSGAIECFKDVFIERNIVSKLLQKGEEGNTRLTKQIHEVLLDYSFHPKLGEAHVSSFILQRIQAHNKSGNARGGSAERGKEENQQVEVTLGSYKGLLSNLALLYKLVNSFGVSVKKRGPLNVKDIMNVIMPTLSHSSQDVRNASTKILLDVHRYTGSIKEEMLQNLNNDKLKATIMDQLSQVQVLEQDQGNKENDEHLFELSADDQATHQQLEKALVNINEVKEKIVEKGTSKDWTEREQALRQLKETFEQGQKQDLLEDDFLTNCTVLLKSCLEDNNITLYLEAIEVAQIFFQKVIQSEIVQGSLQSLMKAIILRTTDTNTRVRKRSIDVINQVWNSPIAHQPSKSSQDDKKQSISTQIAEAICDQSHQEKAISGRLSLLIKKIALIDSPDLLNTKPHQMIIGKNYEQLTEFACQWVSHKNTTVRQNALKLIIEICRLNSIDPRGQPFKQRIINYILGLRPSLRDPLVKKINETCQMQAQNDGEEEQSSQMYIDVNELELNLATKTRSISHDIRKKPPTTKQNSLPDIGGSSQALPQVFSKITSHQPTIVLPHSEPLSEEQKEKYKNLIDLFNLEIITCFCSQTWSTRLSAIEKVDEQLQHLDPHRRDPMSSEINKQNLPVEENFITFVEFISEGIKDPNLKNFISILELMQRALPIFFRHIQQTQIRKELMPLVSQIIRKTTDLKAKVREASINFCLYLSHQSPIGPEVMVEQILNELEKVSVSQTQNVAANLGNSHMISSGLQLLQQFQQQTKILEKEKTNRQMYQRFVNIINLFLKHQNPMIRKEAETLFKILYQTFGDQMDKVLTGQKQQLQAKLIQEAKAEFGQSEEEKQQEENIQRASTQIKNEVINQTELTNLLQDQKENLNNLKLPNPKKRQKAIIEIKKAIQKLLVNLNSKSAKSLSEPLTMLLRQLLTDENSDVYLEALNLLKYVVSSISPHLSTLDLHLMMGQFLSIIVNNTVSGNIRIQVASDKVIIFFAKHNNIGPYVVARDILKNIEKILKAISASRKEDQQSVLQEKKPTLLRFLNLLQLLLQHFSVILCYQAEFYDKCIEQLADSLLWAQDDQAIKSLCTQLIMNLNQIDSKLLDQAISKQDFTRKTPLKKILIEMEHHQRQGKNVITQDHHAFVAQMNPGFVQESPRVNFRDTRDSFASSARASAFSPGSSQYNGGIGSGLDSSQYEWSRRNIEKQNQQFRESQDSFLPSADRRLPRRKVSVETNLRGRTQQLSQSTVSNFKQEDDPTLSDSKVAVTLPEINQSTYKRYANQTPGIVGQPIPTKQMSMTATGGAGFNSGSSSNRNYMNMMSQEGNSIMGGMGIGSQMPSVGVRPPLYIPQKREGGRSQQPVLAPIQQTQQKTGSESYKTDFNSNLRSSNQVLSFTGQNLALPLASDRKRSLQREVLQSTQNSIFKQQIPQGFSYEAKVTKYKEGAQQNENKDILQ